MLRSCSRGTATSHVCPTMLPPIACQLLPASLLPVQNNPVGLTKHDTMQLDVSHNAEVANRKHPAMARLMVSIVRPDPL